MTLTLEVNRMVNSGIDVIGWLKNIITDSREANENVQWNQKIVRSAEGSYWIDQ